MAIPRISIQWIVVDIGHSLRMAAKRNLRQTKIQRILFRYIHLHLLTQHFKTYSQTREVAFWSAILLERIREDVLEERCARSSSQLQGLQMEYILILLGTGGIFASIMLGMQLTSSGFGVQLGPD